jgi:hypothetical protein
VTALAGGLASTLTAATGITNKSLRALITGLLNIPYTPGQMTYDLRRLRLAGLIRRIKHTDTYVLTPDGIKFAVFYTKLHNRLLRPLMAADQPQAPPDLRQALDTLSRHVDDYITAPASGKPHETRHKRPEARNQGSLACITRNCHHASLIRQGNRIGLNRIIPALNGPSLWANTPLV